MPKRNTPGHDEENCYFGANMENRPPKWTLTEAQKKVIENYKQAKKATNQRWTDHNNPAPKI